MVESITAISVFVRSRPRGRWKGNIKIDLNEVWFTDVDKKLVVDPGKKKSEVSNCSVRTYACLLFHSKNMVSF